MLTILRFFIALKSIITGIISSLINRSIKTEVDKELNEEELKELRKQQIKIIKIQKRYAEIEKQPDSTCATDAIRKLQQVSASSVNSSSDKPRSAKNQG